MLTHWHVAAPEDHLLREWLAGCLHAVHRRGGGEDLLSQEDLLSWEGPGGEVRWYRFPDARSGKARSLTELHAEAVPDLPVVLELQGSQGGVLEVVGTPKGVGSPLGWRWLGTPGNGEFRIPLVSFAGLEEGGSPGVTPENATPPDPTPNPTRVAFALGASLPQAWEGAEALRRAVWAALPELTLELCLDPVGSAGAWEGAGVESGSGGEGRSSYPRLPRVDLRRAGVVVLLERGMEWAPVVLQAFRTGRHVLAPADAEYAGLLADGRGDLWAAGAESEGGAGSLLQHLQGLQADPAAAAVRLRQARAWSRRWTPERSLAQLRQLAETAAEGRRMTPRQRWWTLRREIGIGDILFTLAVGTALKRRDPECRLTVHTAPEHAGWVGWFPGVDRVTSGSFRPGPGECVGDFEARFPRYSDKDRAVAFGEQLGIRLEPEIPLHPGEGGWLLPPRIPAAVRESVARCLPELPPGRPRLAWVPGCKHRGVRRSLPPEAAYRIAEQLAALAQVVWLEETAVEHVPAGVVDLTGACGIEAALGVLAACDLCVSVDSGLLYAAAAFGKPVVGLFTHIGALQRLWLVPRFLALEPALPCAPCGERPDSFQCQAGLAPGAPLPPAPCAQLPWAEHVPAAVRAVLAPDAPGRRLWKLAPGGARLEVSVDGMPPPWPGRSRRTGLPG